MLLRIPLYLILFLTATTTALPSRRKKCATREFNSSLKKDESHETMIKEIKFTEPKVSLFTKQDHDQSQNISITVHWHILDKVTPKQAPSAYDAIKKTLAILNSDFLDSDFQFILDDVSYNPQTALLDMEVLSSIKSEDRVGKATTLNIFSGELQYGILGQATFPQDYESAPLDDGVLITTKALAGSESMHFLGRTLTHEVGHWLGLYHTFSEGCSFPNDFVSDTRPQAQETHGCPFNLKTCTLWDFTGEDRDLYKEIDAVRPFDMIENFMDYSDDNCMKSFTKGQIERMKVHWAIREAYD